MTTTKHSPTPWAYEFAPYTLQETGGATDDDQRQIPAYEIFDVEGTKLFDTNEDLPAEIQEANARLVVVTPRLLTALGKCAPLLADYDEDPGEEGQTYREAMAAIDAAKEAGLFPAADTPARFDFMHQPDENPDRAWVLVDDRFDVTITRTGEGIVVDVYPKDWIDPIDTLTVSDDQVADLEGDPAEADNAG